MEARRFPTTDFGRAVAEKAGPSQAEPDALTLLAAQLEETRSALAPLIAQKGKLEQQARELTATIQTGIAGIQDEMKPLLEQEKALVDRIRILTTASKPTGAPAGPRKLSMTWGAARYDFGVSDVQMMLGVLKRTAESLGLLDTFHAMVETAYKTTATQLKNGAKVSPKLKDEINAILEAADRTPLKVEVLKGESNG